MKIRKSINSARGYFDDKANAENNKKILQTLATNLYDELNDAEIDGVTITVDDVVRSTATDGAYKIWVNIDPADYRDELTLEIISTPDGGGKFICKVYDYNMVSIDQFTIRMSGSKQAVIDKINELVAGINNSQGVESSMKIIRNRITANKRRVVKAAVEGNLDVLAIKKQFPAFFDRVDSGLNKAFADDYEYRDFTIRADQYEDEDGVMFDIVLAHGHDYYADAEEVGDVSIECLITNDYPFVVIVNDSDTIQAEGNSFDEIYDTCVGELIRLAEDYVNFVGVEY